MKLSYLILILLLLTGCQMIPFKKDVPVYRDNSNYDVVCENLSSPRGIDLYFDVKLRAHYYSNIELLDNHGNALSLQKNACLFERSELLQNAPESTKIAKIYQSQCVIGSMNFSEKNLQLLDQECDQFIVRKIDGKVWLLPKNHCFLSLQGS